MPQDDNTGGIFEVAPDDERLLRISTTGRPYPFDSSGQYVWKCARCGGHFIGPYDRLSSIVGLVAFEEWLEDFTKSINRGRATWNKLVDDGATCSCDGRTHQHVPLITDPEDEDLWVLKKD